MYPLSVIITLSVFLPPVASITIPLSLPSETILLMGAESGLTIEIILSAETRLPSPIFISFTVIHPYSIFWICSRIFSNSALTSTTTLAISVFCAFEPMVLISRLASWRMKSSFLPTALSLFTISII